MKKTVSLFQRNYDGDRLVRDEVVPGAEWVAAGEGLATAKMDGSCCLVRGAVLFKRHDRKPTKKARRRGAPFALTDFKPAPDGWEACEDAPNAHTGHWPGWLLVADGPEDRWHREAWERWLADKGEAPADGTYELVGPKVQGNPHASPHHQLLPHGAVGYPDAPRTYDALKAWLAEAEEIEGLVWHHPDGRMAKLKRTDFGLAWPVKR